MKRNTHTIIFQKYKVLIIMLMISFILISGYCVKVFNTATTKVNEVAYSTTALNKIKLETLININVNKIKCLLDRPDQFSEQELDLELKKIVDDDKYISNIDIKDASETSASEPKKDAVYEFKYINKNISFNADYSSELSDLKYEKHSFALIVNKQGILLDESNISNTDLQNELPINKPIPFKIENNNKLTLNGKDYYVLSSHILNDNYYYIELMERNFLYRDVNKMKYISIGVCIITLVLFSYVSISLIRTKKRAQKQFLDLEFFDSVTGCYNIRKFNYEANKLTNDITKNYACIVMDVERFKIINDLFGYDEGNKILKIVGNNLMQILDKKHDVYARSNGANFYILTEYKSDDLLEFKLYKLMDSIKNDYDRYTLGFDIGIAKLLKEDCNRDINILSDHAKLAQCSNSFTLGTQYKYYSDSLRNSLILDDTLSNDMHKGIENREFEVYIQPKYCYSTKKVVGGEALIRWNHPELGLLYPGSFISLFEKNGFICELDNYVLEVVMHQCRIWQNAQLPIIPISVNQSKIFMHDENYLKIMESMVKRNKIEPSWIQLEITETILSQNLELIKTLVNALRKLGFSIAMDDFGSGYSSLNLLNEVEFDVLKLDRIFIENNTNINRTSIILQSIINMANNLDMEIIAEGVESQKQLDFLENIDCHTIQGFLYSEALKITDFEKLTFK
ncbi:MAG: GGDEF domain-containing phosphodiesterase [Erysipelotrichaceae bacterium]